MPMFVKLGLSGGIKRYLDDVLLLLQWNFEADLVRVRDFVVWLSSVYPPPLVLNMEAEGDKVFLEAKVLKTSEGVVCRLDNKVVSDYLAQGAKYRVRLHSLKLVSVDKAVEEVSGIATRCVQYATNATQLTISLLELRLEVCV